MGRLDRRLNQDVSVWLCVHEEDHMTRWWLVVLAIPALAAATPASAQQVCPEGRTFSGACVKPGLGESMRRQTLAYTQPKFSYTAPANLPSEDGQYYVPRDYNELRNLFGVDNVPGCAPTFIFGRGGIGAVCQ
jgi:hypothetical protein